MNSSAVKLLRREVEDALVRKQDAAYQALCKYLGKVVHNGLDTELRVVVRDGLIESCTELRDVCLGIED